MSNPQIHKLMTVAVQHHQSGRLREAEQLYRQVLTIEPNNADALNLLGVLAHAAGQYEVAAQLGQRAIAIRREADFFVNTAEALRALKRFEEALTLLQQAIRIDPKLPEAYNNLGSALGSLGRFDEATAAIREALRLRPGYDSALINLGNVLEKLGRGDEAIEMHRAAVRANPRNAAGLTNLGNLLQHRGNLEEAAQVLRSAIAIDPPLSQAHNNLANTLQEQGFLAESIAEYEKALALRPDDNTAHSNLLFALNRDGTKLPEQVFAAHVEFGKRHKRNQQAHGNDHSPERLLRIGYVSPDFKTHPVGMFIGPALERHDRQRFHVTCYSDAERPDAMTAKLRGNVEEWRTTTVWSDEKLAEQIRADGIDLLIDLAGHTKQNRMLTFARKPAPVQITYLGYPNTSGLQTMDYRITDAIADPIGETERFHTEKLIRLPGTFLCYTPPADAPEVGELPATRNGYVTFGSFNNWAKVTPAVLELWAQILMRVKDSRLRLKARSLGDEPTRKRVVQFMTQRGIAENRIEAFGFETSTAGHLAAYSKLDVSLDTHPYNGTTTTCEALWMGVPVVTWAGQTHPARVSASVLHSVGLGDLAGCSAEQYVQKACALAQKLDNLAEIRRTLRQRMLGSPLCDTSSFIRNLESAYRDAWRTWCLTGGGSPA